MHYPISTVVLAMTLALSAGSVRAECYFVSLREFHVSKSADPFSKGDFTPLIAIEPGRWNPLAPEHELEAPHATVMLGREYYIPRHLIDEESRFSLRLMMLDLDKDTPDDLVLPPNERSVSMTTADSTTDTHLVTVHFSPFSDEAQAQSNAQRFTFEISKRAGPCNEDTVAGRTADRGHREDNELRRLHARVMFYDRSHPVGGHDYQPYRAGGIKAARLPLALARAYDVARVNALELIALGNQVRALQDRPGFERVWTDYSRLVRRLAFQKIPLRYKDKKKVAKMASAPSLAFHPGWKELSTISELPVLPKEWGIAITQQ